MRLTRWEWFKLRKRWMPWILLGIAVAMTQLSLWSDYLEYRNIGRNVGEFYRVSVPNGEKVRFTCVDVVEGNVDAKLALIPERSRQRVIEAIKERRTTGMCEDTLASNAERRGFHREGLVLPSSLSNGLGGANSFGILLVMILGASAMGVEYGWGTLRTVLTRGINRWQFLGAEDAVAASTGGAGFIIIGLGVVVSSVVFASFITGDGGGLADSGHWSTVVVMFAKAVYGLAPYIALALFLSVLTSSSSMGIAISLAYFIVELILIQVLGGLFNWFNTVAEFMLGPSIAGWMPETGVRSSSWIADAGIFTQRGGSGQGQ